LLAIPERGIEKLYVVDFTECGCFGVAPE